MSHRRGAPGGLARGTRILGFAGRTIGVPRLSRGGPSEDREDVTKDFVQA